MIAQSSVSLLEHPSSSMSCRFIWPSMDAHPPVGPVYIADWKLRLVTRWSGDWWLWFIETFRSLPIRLVASGAIGHLDVSMEQECWLYCTLCEKKSKYFSQWLENVPYNCWATVPLYCKNDLNELFSQHNLCKSQW